MDSYAEFYSHSNESIKYCINIKKVKFILLIFYNKRILFSFEISLILNIIKMARSKNNVVTHGLSGKVGDLLVFSQRNGKTFVGKVPKESTKELSEGQKAHRLKFQKAVLYAKSVLNDPAKKELYEEGVDRSKGQTTYNVAVADLLNAPDIESIDLSAYTGNVGDVIRIMVTDDFGVEEVKVKIENGDGSLVEEGNAVNSGVEWIYTATVQNTDLVGDKVTITASDAPANLSEKIENL